MADGSRSRAQRRSSGLTSSAGRDIRPDRRRSRPAVESLESRRLLAAASSPSSPVPVSPEPVGQPTPQQIAAAYRQVLAIQHSTLQALSASHRRLYAAFDQLAARAHPAVARDRRVLQQGADLTSRAEQGLVVARGVEDQAANTDKIYIPNGVYTTLASLIRQAQTTGTDLARSARRSTDAAVDELDALAARLVDPAASRT